MTQTATEFKETSRPTYTMGTSRRWVQAPIVLFAAERRKRLKRSGPNTPISSVKRLRLMVWSSQRARTNFTMD